MCIFIYLYIYTHIDTHTHVRAGFSWDNVNNSSGFYSRGNSCALQALNIQPALAHSVAFHCTLQAFVVSKGWPLATQATFKEIIVFFWGGGEGGEGVGLLGIICVLQEPHHMSKTLAPGPVDLQQKVNETST